MALVAGQSEWLKQAALNANKYRKPNLQQQLRSNILSDNKPANQSEDAAQPESIHKSRLALLKAGAIREANKQTGAYVGGVVGGAAGSVVPIIGTGVGAFLGRLVGKKLGIIGIVILALVTNILLALLLIMMLKYGCNKTYGVQWIIGIRDLCAVLGE